MSVDEILDKISQYQCKLVEITGGEPLIQNEFYDLVKKLQTLNYTILIETNGSQDTSELPKDIIKIIDWKTPGSGENLSFETDNLNHLTKDDEIKFVCADLSDYEWSKACIKKYNLTDNCNVLMSVVKGELNPADLCEAILKDNLDVRFQLQLHKYVWPKDKKGR